MTSKENSKKEDLPVLVRFTIHPSERDWLKNQAENMDMSIVAYIKARIIGSHYDPNTRNVLLRLNKDLTLYGRTLDYIRDSIKLQILAQNQIEAMLQDIRTPLIEALRAIKQFLAQGMTLP